ncbi:hypothetical protein Desti_0919 [Desulfomonile tiedjei DSM 6799]|uniref:Uncharacterized protein n=2 Tax=Desulfomonile tiedjei TaxID=2358 RepID=I4C247_DESTA|nr:hypothetical protein Desti_0919 [Desulfomonile tiedjei DSM 6799]
MRAPKRKHVLPRQIERPEVVNGAAIAERVSYIGSPEHKDTPSFAGQPRPRADASLCDRQLSQDHERVTQWLQTAILRGAIGGMYEGDFPRYVWYKDGDVVYEARLVNRESGEYKGYPLNKTEWPEGLDSIYG